MDQRITELGARVTRLERRLSETERDRRRPHPPAFVRTLLPDETRAHLREARRHVWLALRALVDARVEGSSVVTGAEEPRGGIEERPGRT